MAIPSSPWHPPRPVVKHETQPRRRPKRTRTNQESTCRNGRSGSLGVNASGCWMRRYGLGRNGTCLGMGSAMEPERKSSVKVFIPPHFHERARRLVGKSRALRTKISILGNFQIEDRTFLVAMMASPAGRNRKRGTCRRLLDRDQSMASIPCARTNSHGLRNHRNPIEPTGRTGAVRIGKDQFRTGTGLLGPHLLPRPCGIVRTLELIVMAGVSGDFHGEGVS